MSPTLFLNIFDMDDNKAINCTFSSSMLHFFQPLTLNWGRNLTPKLDCNTQYRSTHPWSSEFLEILPVTPFFPHILPFTSYWGLHGSLCGSEASPHQDTVPPSGLQLAACVSAGRSAPGVRPSGWEWTAKGAPASGSVLWGTYPWWLQPWHPYKPKHRKEISLILTTSNKNYNTIGCL